MSIQATVIACVKRLLAAWPPRVGQREEAWAKEMGQRFSIYPSETVENVTEKAIDKFKHLPSIASMVELLREQTEHESYINRAKQEERIVIPIDQQSDAEIVDQLVRRAMRNAPWPVVESEHGKCLAQQAARAFLREMDRTNDYHRMGFYMLKNRGFIPNTARLDS